MTKSRTKLGLAIVLVGLIAGGSIAVARAAQQSDRLHVVAYFDNSNGVFVGDDVRIKGVRVGGIDAIEPQPTQVKIAFWVDAKYTVPADAKAVILSPTLVTSRAIQLTPGYTGGPTLHDNAIIPRERTAVPVEFDEVRQQLERLTTLLQPTEPGGVSTLGALVNTAADNLRGQGPAIRDAIIKLSQSVSALADHSPDIFTSVKNLSTLVSALQDSTVLIRQLNQNLASVTGLLTNNPTEVGDAVKNLNDVVSDLTAFVAANRETIGATSDKLTSVSQALTDSTDDIKQLLHIAPTTLSNAANLYKPAQGTLTGALNVANFSDPITFLCGAVQAASRLNNEQSAKLCVQYLAPIIKNRQYNFPPIGVNPFVQASARPNEVTYSEDWMRPDYIPPQPTSPLGATASDPNAPPPLAGPALPAEAPVPVPGPSDQQTDPAAGLPGMMIPPGGGS
ncbi:MCE family protein [Mycolicibacterium frederiksbergense]|uniref:MCE family protein n=1 Tax=Mycolicibacterium frederiksbergense TaxID=117567 RepID=A0A6H0S0C9_9MYCO|nr:MCE family protein [Mycolicibacterium frederiksbergense]QIV80636.1 MCE family protein [Mycolicibacterium frederiksbergense]